MDTTKQYEEFEVWFNKEVFSLKLADSKLVNCYWDAWQAAQKVALASIEIELKTNTSNSDAFTGGYNHAIRKCRAILTAAGLRVKS